MSTSVFRGLNNVTDPMRLGAEWLVQADNVNVTDSGGVTKRRGHARTIAGAITGAHSTFDFERAYIVDTGGLKALTPTGATVTLRSGLSAAPMYWAEINDQVYFNNGVDSGIIHPDNTVLDWRWTAPTAPTLAPVTGSLAPGLYQVRCTFTLADGRETGAGDEAAITLGEDQALQISGIPQRAGSTTNIYIAPADSQVYQYATSPSGTAIVWNSKAESLGVDLLTAFTDPLPMGADIVQFWRGRAYAAQHFAADGVSAVWFSQPLGFHLFDLNSAYLQVPGHVQMLAQHPDALIIGTDQRVYAYDGKGLVEIASYGVIPGWHAASDEADRRLLFWSTRGLCSALPFKNLTERQVSVAPGASAGGTVVFADGQRRYVVALKQGGAAFNPHT